MDFMPVSYTHLDVYKRQLHDCYVAVWNGAESYVSRGKPMAWIITIAKNLCLQRMRERKKAECTSQEGWELAIPDTDMLTMEDRSILVTCMEQLSDEERQIVDVYKRQSVYI